MTRRDDSPQDPPTPGGEAPSGPPSPLVEPGPTNPQDAARNGAPGGGLTLHDLVRTKAGGLGVIRRIHPDLGRARIWFGSYEQHHDLGDLQAVDEPHWDDYRVLCARAAADVEGDNGASDTLYRWASKHFVDRLALTDWVNEQRRKLQ